MQRQVLACYKDIAQRDPYEPTCSRWSCQSDACCMANLSETQIGKTCVYGDQRAKRVACSTILIYLTTPVPIFHGAYIHMLSLQVDCFITWNPYRSTRRLHLTTLGLEPEWKVAMQILTVLTQLNFLFGPCLTSWLHLCNFQQKIASECASCLIAAGN